MARQAITPFPARPPRYSLILVAEALTLTDDVLGAGYVFEPEACGTQRGGVAELDCGGGTDEMTVGNMPPRVEGDPFVIFAWDECSTLGWRGRDFVGRATRMLLASQSFWLARELAVGSLGLEQRSLNDPAAVTLTSAPVEDVAEALSIVEQGIADVGRGEPGMVHVTIGMLTRLMAANAIRLDGSLWRTASSNVVVADAGYTGAGPGDDTPDAGSEFMYGTSLIGVQLGDPLFLPDNFDDASIRGTAVDRGINLLTMYAERAAVWVWDECIHVAAEVAAPEGLAS